MNLSLKNVPLPQLIAMRDAAASLSQSGDPTNRRGYASQLTAITAELGSRPEVDAAVDHELANRERGRHNQILCAEKIAELRSKRPLTPVQRQEVDAVSYTEHLNPAYYDSTGAVMRRDVCRRQA